MSNDIMVFPETWEMFEHNYGFTDTKEIYTNGARLIPSFRVKQWLDHIAKPEERTAKVIKHDYVIHYVEEHYIHEKEGSEFLCGFCKKKVLDGDDYCSHCGTKLDWSWNE